MAKKGSKGKVTKTEEKEIVIDLTAIIKKPWRTTAVILGITVIVLLVLQFTNAGTKSALPEEFQNAINQVYTYNPQYLEFIFYIFGNPIVGGNHTIISNTSSMTNDQTTIIMFYSPRSISSLRMKTFTMNDVEALIHNKTNIQYVDVDRLDIPINNETYNKYSEHVTRLPTLIINDKYLITGEIEPSKLINLLCNEYQEKPQVCYTIN